jgi:hypothetical protein
VQSASGRGGGLLAEDEEQSTKLATLGLRETREELVFGIALRLRGAFELQFARSRDRDDVLAPVVCVALA